ncbi:MAG TPA: hypothetical protein VGY94_07250, partial [Acidobacteriaceae bacterium]|nr:hypothetical protein [Acidobacteriaceae bacterium]
MSTEAQEHAKIEQLQHASPDDIEVAAGRDREDLQGWVPSLASDEEVREALEKAFDYRGDITITKKDGSMIEGYVFDRRTGATLAASQVRVLLPGSSQKISIPYNEIAGLAFSGRDTAAGKSFDAWVKKYWEKKAAG